MDIKQPLKLKGLITIDHDSEYNTAAQAIFRLRNLNYGHTIDYL